MTGAQEAILFVLPLAMPLFLMAGIALIMKWDRKNKDEMVGRSIAAIQEAERERYTRLVETAHSMQWHHPRLAPTQKALATLAEENMRYVRRTEAERARYRFFVWWVRAKMVDRCDGSVMSGWFDQIAGWN